MTKKTSAESYDEPAAVKEKFVVKPYEPPVKKEPPKPVEASAAPGYTKEQYDAAVAVCNRFDSGGATADEKYAAKKVIDSCGDKYKE